MVDILDSDVFLHIVSVPGLDGNGITEPDALALRNDIDEILDRPVVTTMDDLADVETSGVTTGDVLVWNASTSVWEVSSQANITVADTTSVNLTLDDGELSAAVVFGGSGSAGTAARSDHLHTVAWGGRTEFNASGYISGSSRTVVSTSVTLAAGIQYLVKATLKVQMRGADAGAGYYTMTTTIGGNPRTSAGGSSGGFWCVQGVPNKEIWTHYRTITGTGTAVPITGSIAYWGGSGFNIDAGEMDIELFPSR